MTTGHNSFSRARIAALLVTALALAGCETTGTGAGPAAQAAAAAGPPQPPMTHSRAAQECWMGTEKGTVAQNLDKRADLVTKCIDDKMKSGDAAPKG